MRRLLILMFVGMSILLWSGLPTQTVDACGGLFCQNSPVDQNAERIIFTQNGDGTTSAIIEIQFTGFNDDFSWILPLPNAISAEDIEVPETAVDAFVELQQATNVRFITPPTPSCVPDMLMFEEEAETSSGVEVFASGEVGPYGFDVIGAEDPTALINWLRENKYLVTEPMEPLIDVYVEEGFFFLAMRLLPNEGTDSITPVKVTYETDEPMIPLRLTAVAANQNMGIYTWFFADQQAVPANFAHLEIPNEDITLFDFGGNDYLQLIGQRANDFGGQGFITEYAQPTQNLSFNDPLLQELGRKHAYLTRLYTQISPDEMTLDPVFRYDAQREDVSNVRDLSEIRGLYQCERDSPSAISTLFGSGNTLRSENEPLSFGTGILFGGVAMLVMGILVVVGIAIGRRKK